MYFFPGRVDIIVIILNRVNNLCPGLRRRREPPRLELRFYGGKGRSSGSFRTSLQPSAHLRRGPAIIDTNFHPIRVTYTEQRMRQTKVIPCSHKPLPIHPPWRNFGRAPWKKNAEGFEVAYDKRWHTTTKPQNRAHPNPHVFSRLHLCVSLCFLATACGLLCSRVHPFVCPRSLIPSRVRMTLVS